MLLRRTLPITLVAFALACEPKVPHCDASTSTDPACKGSLNPATVDYAAFDLTSSPPDIPLPNDLVLQPQAIATQSGAQQELLQSFVDSKGNEIGFPSDQEVPITIDFVRQTIDPNTGAAARSAPDLDVTSINKDPAHPNLVVLSLGASSLGASIAIDMVKATDYFRGPDHGTLTVHKAADAGTGSRRWAPGQYVAAVRGGVNGVQVSGSTAGVNPQPTMYLLLQGKNLNAPENQGLIPGKSAAEKASTGAQLEKLRSSYVLPLVFVNKSFAAQEVAVLSTFLIAPQTAHIEVDPDAGAVPLPSDFLSGADGHLSDKATALFNTQLPGLGDGLRTLDGFSTTAGIITQGTLGTAFQADSLTSDSIFLYEINTKGSPTATRYPEVHELINNLAPRYAIVPIPVPVTLPPGAPPLSGAIFLQPAVPAPLPAAFGGGFYAIPPLNEGTTYGVVITDRVKDQNGTPLTRSSLAKLLFFKNKLFDGGHATVAGLDDATAGGLERLRAGVVPLLAGSLQRDASLSADHIAFVYTFHTQTFTSDANHLAALPYSPALPAAGGLPIPGATILYCPAGSPNPHCVPGTKSGAAGHQITAAGTIQTEFDKYGVDTNAAGTATVPSGNIGGIVESIIPTFNNLTDPRGVFSDPTKVPPALELAPVIIAVPKCATLPTPCVAPLVVFRHGVFSSRASVLSLADRFTSAGFVIAAIDASKHGARSFCSADAECTTSCVHDPTLMGQLDPAGATPGHCKDANPIDSKLVNAPVLCPTGGATCNTLGKNQGTPTASGNFLLGANLFRTRDTLRQDLIDQAQLIRVLAIDPSGLLQTPPVPIPDTEEIFHAIADNFGVIINPAKVYFIGQSLGSISGTLDVATNPRISKATLNVGGGTIVDVFRTSPSLSGRLNALLGGLGIQTGTAKFLQFINVAKWVLDPADPLNFADRLIKNPLPNLLIEGKPGSLPAPLNMDPQAPKAVLAQVANCDQTVPNDTNYELDQLIGLGRDTPTTPTGTLQRFHFQANSSVACPGGLIPHGFITDWGFSTKPADVPGSQASFSFGVAEATRQAQDDAAAFFKDDTHPPVDRDSAAP